MFKLCKKIFIKVGLGFQGEFSIGKLRPGYLNLHVRNPNFGTQIILDGL